MHAQEHPLDQAVEEGSKKEGSLMQGRAACVMQCPRRCASPLHWACCRCRDEDKQRSPVGSPGTSSSSVLGKCVQEKDKDNFIVSKSADMGPLGLGLGVSVGAGTAVTTTPYLSRDTTYCYRHCKGISHFPLLLYHPSPRPMPDWITSAFLTSVHVTPPHRTLP